MRLKHIFALALFLVGGVSLVLPSGYSVGFYLLCFLGLTLWFKQRGSLIPTETHNFFGPLLAYAITHCAMALHEKWGAREFANYLPFVLVLFGVWGIRQYRPRAEWFWGGLATGAIGAALLAGYQSYALGARAGGHTNPIQFGNIALLFGVVCMVRAMVIGNLSRLNVLMWVGFISGLAASVWSQTRGGWLAVLLIFFWIVSQATKTWPITKRILAALVLLTVLAIPAFQPNGVVQARVAEATREVEVFLSHGKQDTSVGARLAMWSIAAVEISKAPWFGHGDKGWIATRDAAVADGRLSSFSAKFSHLHNEYLNVAFKRGLVGLLFHMALFLVPMLIFFKPYLHDESPDVRALAMAGMVIPMMFMDFGLTQTFLSHNSGRVVLCGLWMCVAGLMLNAVHNRKTDVKE